jgi:hypothetical protein
MLTQPLTQVLAACQLTHDMHILQDGDMTMIGERGNSKHVWCFVVLCGAVR